MKADNAGLIIVVVAASVAICTAISSLWGAPRIAYVFRIAGVALSCAFIGWIVVGLLKIGVESLLKRLRKRRKEG